MTDLTWLHISDWHQGFDDDQFDCDARDALKTALIDDIENRTALSNDLDKIDLIIFSGDVAYSGRSDEYSVAKREFFIPLLKATNLKPKQLFIVPGNHDLNRKLISENLRIPLRTDTEVREWLSKEKIKEVLEPFQEFTTFVTDFTNQPQPDYASTLIFTKESNEIAITGLNSAWMCGRDSVFQDSGALLVGKPQLYRSLNQIQDSAVKIAVMHHPVYWLAPFEVSHIERDLENQCDFLLTGHRHDPIARQISNQNGFYITISTGASYLGPIPNDPLEITGYNFVRFNLESRDSAIFFRKWSNRNNEWVKDIEAAGNDEGTKMIYGLNSKKRREIASEKASSLYVPRERKEVQGSADELYRNRRMIDQLSIDLTVDNILKTEQPGDIGDPIEPIKLIILKSLNENDQGALAHGLNTISNKVGDEFESPNTISDVDTKKISDVLYFHFSLVGSLAVQKQDIYACSKIISAIKNIAVRATERNYGFITYKSINIIEELGEKGANEKFGDAATKSADAIKDIGVIAKDMPSQFEYVSQWVSLFIGRIAISAIRNNLKIESRVIINALGDIGMTFTRDNIKAAASSAADGLGKIASECITPEYKDAGISAITYLRNIGILATKNGIPSVVGSAAESLGNLVYVVADRKYYDTIPLITWSLGAIGVQSAGDEKLDRSSHTVADRLEKLVRVVSDLADFNQKSEVIPQVVSDLGTIGLKAAENGITIVASRVAYAFGEVGLIALKNNIGKDVLEVHLDSIYNAANKTAEMNNNMGSVLYQIGRTYNMLGFYQSAEKASRRALEVDSANNLARIQLHNSLSSQGNIDEAKEVLKEYHRFEREKKKT